MSIKSIEFDTLPHLCRRHRRLAQCVDKSPLSRHTRARDCPAGSRLLRSDGLRRKAARRSGAREARSSHDPLVYLPWAIDLSSSLRLHVAGAARSSGPCNIDSGRLGTGLARRCSDATSPIRQRSPDRSRRAQAPGTLRLRCSVGVTVHRRKAVPRPRRPMPQRGNGLQPRVVAQRLPWEDERVFPTTPKGLRLFFDRHAALELLPPICAKPKLQTMRPPVGRMRVRQEVTRRIARVVLGRHQIEFDERYICA